MERANLAPLCTILDKIGSVPWKINKPILDVVTNVYNSGGGIAEVPIKEDHKEITKADIKKAKGDEKKTLIRARKIWMEQHGLRCEFLLRMSIANEFSKCSEIYFPHNIDFRGRTYPLPPNLNHMGPDICRGMLIFSNEKELGPRGLYWLKIHLANSMGKDKLSLKDRVAYVDENLDWILKCGKDPYQNTRWLECESPWQSLAAMIEVYKAISFGNIEKYKCGLPIQVDGSCNGLQHYSAIGRDNVGGRKVNLADSPKPGDVYTAVLEAVKLKVASENRPEFIEIAKTVYPHLARKIVKQTVMTSVYGVTFIGAREQIAKQLAQIPTYHDEKLLYKTAIYLARFTIQSIGDIFSDADRIKEWFHDTARKVAHLEKPMIWESQLKFPIIQPYHKNEMNRINMGNHRTSIRLPNAEDVFLLFLPPKRKMLINQSNERHFHPILFTR